MPSEWASKVFQDSGPRVKFHIINVKSDSGSFILGYASLYREGRAKDREQSCLIERSRVDGELLRRREVASAFHVHKAPKVIITIGKVENRISWFRKQAAVRERRI